MKKIKQMTIADLIQISILITLVVTAYFAVKGINRTKRIHQDTLVWNKKNKTIDTLNEFRKIKPNLVKIKFKDFLDNPKQSIPIKDLLKEIKKDPRIGFEIDEYLNHYEGIAIGIKQNLYDGEMVKLARKTSIYNTWIQYKEYIEYFRKDNDKLWDNFESLANQCNDNELQYWQDKLPKSCW